MGFWGFGVLGYMVLYGYLLLEMLITLGGGKELMLLKNCYPA